MLHLDLSHLTVRRACTDDIEKMIELYLEDDLGLQREVSFTQNKEGYLSAFEKIDSDSNQHLMVLQYHRDIIGTCHLTLMPSLTYRGTLRMQIEAVRMADRYRGNGLGTWMLEHAIAWAKDKGVGIVQLTTNLQRADTQRFYSRLGFNTSHAGMKLFLDKISA